MDTTVDRQRTYAAKGDRRRCQKAIQNHAWTQSPSDRPIVATADATYGGKKSKLRDHLSQ